ncbi:MAG: indole-3-glycerol phosphate synthase TrpC [Anaerolineales bacterium]|nr:indole-3-glycerol phosphate synthase TrpC [Anaerolineales bacterium]
MSILDTIFAHKREEVAARKLDRPLAEVQHEAECSTCQTAFLAALCQARRDHDSPALIAEIKKASPSRGVLVEDFDPCRLARLYRDNGAAAISVLTDEKFFQGSLDCLQLAAWSVLGVPLLRKDFIFDPYQLYEARAAGASAVLLIAAQLDPCGLRELHLLALTLNLTPLIEVHDRAELDMALACDPLLIGINNRDLCDFRVSLETTFNLRPHIPDGIFCVAESGIQTFEDVARLRDAGVDAILVGEALVTAVDVAAKVRELTGRPQG